MPAVSLSSVARLPHTGDNVAVALNRLEVGTTIAIDGSERQLRHTVLEGHRFAVKPIAPGEPLLSWGRPFGFATRAIASGDYVCNAQTLEILSQRDLKGARLPTESNFESRLQPYVFDPAAFRPAEQAGPSESGGTFAGFPRAGGRGVGTRNHIVLLGTSARSAAFVRALETEMKAWPEAAAPAFPSDRIVAVGHTEGGGAGDPNNRAEVLRALAGFMVNPNVAAVLAVDEGSEAITNRTLEEFARSAGYPLDHVPHRYLSLGGRSLADSAAMAKAIVREWLPAVAATSRVHCPLSGLRIGLQCGGSDAFSGISANPLLGMVGREIIRHGGAVNLAETDELVGAESYVLAKVRDLATAERFLALMARFKERLGWHGASVEGNPSGGNRLRGLYNIHLKSLGAAMKKSPDVRIDHAIDYAEPMRWPGFYFMNSPGNDLESVAGQVGAGCNLIFFTTGNGSVTNFPFVPTIKVTSTTRRHRLLEHEMDVNAGAYLDGTPMEALTREMFDLVRRVAGGERTKGERAGHSQVSLWREWRQTSPANLPALRARARPNGKPVPRAATAATAPRDPRLEAVLSEGASGPADHRQPVNLVIPTSLCSSQIARLAAERLNSRGTVGGRFVALPHTEGCGFAGEALYALLPRTYRAYATHPAVAHALFLEHGCEKIPNDVVKRELSAAGVDPSRFGWASVQLDGGIESVLGKIEAWFAAAPGAPAEDRGDSPPPTLGLVTEGVVSEESAAHLGRLSDAWVHCGGSVVVAQTDQLLSSAAFLQAAGLPPHAPPTLAYGQPLREAGFHQVDTESTQWTENLTGLAACGAEIFLSVLPAAVASLRADHPFVPLVRLPSEAPFPPLAVLAHDLLSAWAAANPSPFGDFQFTRGELGVST